MAARLPPEIKHLILSHLDNNGLANVCQTSKAFCSIAQPLLFSFVRINSGQQFLQFAKAIFGPFKLGRFVERLFLRFYSIPSEDIQPKDIAALFMPPVEELFPLPHTKEAAAEVANWRQNVDNLAPSFLIASLLTCTPRLKTLYLKIQWTLEPIAFVAAHGNQYLHGLENIDIEGRTFRLLDAFPLLCLPSLEEFCAVGCVGASKSEAGGSLEVCWPPQGGWNISSLVFLNSCIDGVCMTKLIESCKALESLVYEASNYPNHSSSTPTQLTKALNRHRDHLDTLEVNMDDTEMEGDSEIWDDELFDLLFDWDTNPWKYGPLDQFCKLSQVRVDQRYLHKDHSFPPSLVVLHVYNCCFPIFDFLRRLARLKTSTLANLRDVILQQPQEPSTSMLDIDDFQSATKEMITEKCDMIDQIFEDTNISILYDREIWEGIQAWKEGKDVDLWDPYGHSLYFSF